MKKLNTKNNVEEIVKKVLEIGKRENWSEAEIEKELEVRGIVMRDGV